MGNGFASQEGRKEVNKFKQGLRFRHDNTRDTDILVISQDDETTVQILITIIYLYRNTGKPIPGTRQQIPIRQSDVDSWKQVLG